MYRAPKDLWCASKISNKWFLHFVDYFRRTNFHEQKTSQISRILFLCSKVDIIFLGCVSLRNFTPAKKKNPKVLNIFTFCTIFTLLDSESNNNLVVKIFNNMKTNEKSMRSAQKYNCLKKNNNSNYNSKIKNNEGVYKS